MKRIVLTEAGDDGARMVEPHLLDFDDDLYGRTLSTDLLERLRLNERFDSLDALVAQMEVDKARAREALARESALLRSQAPTSSRM